MKNKFQEQLNGLLKAQRMARAGVLFAPESFILASETELMNICNGCGAANAKFDFVPDRIYGTDIAPACQIHDWGYSEGVTIEDKEKEDRIWKNNLFRLIELDKHKWYKPTSLQKLRVSWYYWLVKERGGPAFWANKNPIGI